MRPTTPQTSQPPRGTVLRSPERIAASEAICGLCDRGRRRRRRKERAFIVICLAVAALALAQALRMGVVL
jgi:hypothetical protein